ncbi:MAG: T9SS type A sorting domain-containing protein, partial [Flavobacteriaceae bacterium]|nr:T9SS type A sorting domain-containing protein [Flavobacteriaceae bacterium]
CSGISNRSITQELKVFPNPTNGLLNIELTGYSNELNIDLYSLRGRMIYSENLSDNSTDKVLSRQINLSRYGKGVYFVRITNEGESETKKVLVM